MPHGDCIIQKATAKGVWVHTCPTTSQSTPSDHVTTLLVILTRLHSKAKIIRWVVEQRRRCSLWRWPARSLDGAFLGRSQPNVQPLPSTTRECFSWPPCEYGLSHATWAHCSDVSWCGLFTPPGQLQQSNKPWRGRSRWQVGSISH